MHLKQVGSRQSQEEMNSFLSILSAMAVIRAG